jgi:hypothetical protein
MPFGKSSEAFKAISQFTHSFNEHFRDADSPEVAQLNVQFFWHTDPQVEV